MQIRFPISEIPSLAGRYFLSSSEKEMKREAVIEMSIAHEVFLRGYYTKDEFEEVCFWKTPRTQPRVQTNSEEYIQVVTQTALSSRNERLRIEVLTLLQGVSWPTASVLLHFGFKNQYPILDFRALWSLGIEILPKYDFNFWWEYTGVCRELAKVAGVSMRMLDRALWQYSKENG